MVRRDDSRGLSNIVGGNFVIKGLFHVAILLTCILPLVGARAGQAGDARYEFVSPVPGARFVSPGTDIILRPGRTLEAGETLPPQTLSITGSRSGAHSVTCILSDDQRTLVFRPDRPFAADEVVSVQLSAGKATSLGNELEPLNITFTTRGHAAALSEKASILDELPQTTAPLIPRVPPTLKSSGSTADTLPADFPSITVTASGKTVIPGELFLANFTIGGPVSTPYLIVAATDGTPLWYRKMNGPCFDFKKQTNGLLTYYDSSVGCFIAMDSAYAVVDTFRCGNGYSTDDHELELLPNGHALLMSYDTEPYAMDTVVAGGNPNAQVTGLVIQELDRNKNVVFQWRSWDHVKITDAIQISLLTSSIDYIHGNALDLDHDGNIILSCRHFSEVTKIDRQTGNIIWRWGGKNNQFTFTNDSLGFSFQHAVRRLPNGHITLFDNGNLHSPSFSRGMEYLLDEQNKTATLVWEYRHSPPLFGFATGYVQRQDDASTLIDWGATNPNVTLVARDSTAIFDLSFPQGVFSYRAYLYPQSEVTTAVGQSPGIPAAFHLEQNYPNPFNPSTNIRFEVPQASHVNLSVYDILGHEVSVLVNDRIEAGVHEVKFDGTNLASGVYFYRLQAGENVATKKLLLVR
jgi:hypothetical protein